MELDLRDLNKQVLKMNLYEKFKRERDLKDRLARIEEALTVGKCSPHEHGGPSKTTTDLAAVLELHEQLLRYGEELQALKTQIGMLQDVPGDITRFAGEARWVRQRVDENADILSELFRRTDAGGQRDAYASGNRYVAPGPQPTGTHVGESGATFEDPNTMMNDHRRSRTPEAMRARDHDEIKCTPQLAKTWMHARGSQIFFDGADATPRFNSEYCGSGWGNEPFQGAGRCSAFQPRSSGWGRRTARGWDAESREDDGFEPASRLDDDTVTLSPSYTARAWYSAYPHDDYSGTHHRHAPHAHPGVWGSRTKGHDGWEPSYQSAEYNARDDHSRAQPSRPSPTRRTSCDRRLAARSIRAGSSSTPVRVRMESQAIRAPAEPLTN